MGWAGAVAGVISKTILFYFILLLLYKYIIKGKIPVVIWAAARAVWAAVRAVVVLLLLRIFLLLLLYLFYLHFDTLFAALSANRLLLLFDS